MVLSACGEGANAPGPSALAAAAQSDAGTCTQPPDFAALVGKYGAAVVNISTTQTLRDKGFAPGFPGLPEDDAFFEFLRRFAPPPGPRAFQAQSLGSGFIVEDDGYILTNAHVVANADQVVVKLTDKREFKAKVMGIDRRSDVALIKIDAAHLPKVMLGDSRKVKVGEWVAASPRYGVARAARGYVDAARGASARRRVF